MSLPRPVFPDTFYQVTRRCTQRQFLLRPDRETNNAYLYCLLYAAQQTQMELIHAYAASNHKHETVLDRVGRINEFTERHHALVARCLNAHRGRWENFWSSVPTCNVELVTRETVIQKLVYAITNPVKDGLVDRAHQWPGINTWVALRNRRVLRATRPGFFFRTEGNMPAEIEMELTIPPELGSRDEVVAEVDRRVAQVEQAQAEERRTTGRRVFGRGRVLRQSWRDAPDTPEPRRTLRPRFAGSNPRALIAVLGRYKQFLADYRPAFRALKAGNPIPFPPGTYWLRRFVGVPIEPLPPEN